MPQMDFMKNKCLAVESSDAKYAFEDGATDDINNDSDTSSSFSLQECMNEFRARRIRRLCLTQYRQNVDKKGVNNGNCVAGTAEIDFINQNLCNKEQERKFKPCKNGFCYCFTSDSGDAGKSFHSFRKVFKNSRRNRRPVSNSSERTSKSRPSKDHICYVKPKVCEESFLKSTRKVKKSTLAAISSVETSRKDEPLIHITQELHDNCVISKVKVNKHKIKSLGNNINVKEKSVHITSQKKDHFVDQIEQRKRNENDIYNPSAPDLETISDLEIDHVTSQINKHHSNISESRAGQLLQKRFTLSNSSYKRSDIEKVSQNPQMIKFFSQDKLCKSTSASVSKAEREVDDFLVKKDNYMNADIKLITGAMHSSGKRKSHPLTLSETYPSLTNIQNNVELKKMPHHDEIVKPAINNKTNVISMGWNKPKFKDILNDNVHTKNNEFHYISYQPQQKPCTDIVRNEKSIGWKMPPKVSLDTVDGIVHRNLASNFEEKETPRKNKLIKTSQNSKDSSRKLTFLWAEQLRHLSPWPKNGNVSEINNSKHKFYCGSKAFIVSSKKKFLRLVSPKKDKDRHSSQIRKVFHRNVGIQTLSNDDLHNQSNIQSLYQHSSSPQSSPGSYHSPLQYPCIQYPVLLDTENGNKAECNFSTNVHSLPKKVSRYGNRKLSSCRCCTFRLKEGSLQNNDISNSSECCNHNKTYRSFTSEIDQDVCISKISYVLSKIRAKLETNDEDVARAFLESETLHSSLDYAANRHEKLIENRVELKKFSQLSKETENFPHEPIYFEIEDDSFILSGTSDFENRTGIHHFFVGDNPEVFYTKVNKSNKLNRDNIQSKEQKPQMPLSKIMKDSLKSRQIGTNFVPLPPLPEPTENESSSYYLTLPSTLPLPQSQSLNNVRVSEENSSLERHQNLNKSDLSLHRSEIFLENLCKSELFVNPGFRRNIFEMNKNTAHTLGTCRSKNSITQPSANDISCILSRNDLHIACNDSVSYELPNNDVDLHNGTTAGSNMGLSTIVPPSYNNQSTPKKQSFVTEAETFTNHDKEMEKINDDLYNICPNTPQKKSDKCVIRQNPSRSLSMNEVSASITKSNSKMLKVMEGYNSLKNVLHKSFRKSKSFIRGKGKHLSNSLNFSMSNATASPCKQSIADSTPDLNDLLTFNESTSVSEQIAHTVTFCRKLPVMEISMEMVEAERLLLFSAIRRKNQLTSSTATKTQNMSQKSKIRFFIDDMFLPVASHVNDDIFFNNFYIITFECDGVIKSTQSSECLNGKVVLRDIGIEFLYFSELGTDTTKGKVWTAIKCNIFMLRLRKISNVAIEPKKKIIIETLTQTTAEILKSSSSSSSTSSSDFSEVVSRFRLHASFTLDAKDFVPYEYVHQESVNSDRICIRSSCFCNLPLTSRTKSTNLLREIRLKGRAEVRIPKHSFNGFLNVQDPHKHHNWNRRWCTLDGIFLHIWRDESSFSSSPVLSIDLRDSTHNYVPLVCSPRELCARPRSFCLESRVNEPSENITKSLVFFSADTQNNVDDWLKNLNIAFDFITIWL